MNSNIPPSGPKGKASPLAGGIFIFIGLIVGAIIGIAYDQPSLGMIGGFGIGVALAVFIWLADILKNKDQ